MKESNSSRTSADVLHHGLALLSLTLDVLDLGEELLDLRMGGSHVVTVEVRGQFGVCTGCLHIGRDEDVQQARMLRVRKVRCLEACV